MTDNDPESGPIGRDLPPVWERAIFWLGAAFSLWHLYVALFADVSELTRNALHFGGFAAFCAVLTPAIKGRDSAALRWADLALGGAILLSAVWLALAEDAIYERGVRLSALDWIAGTVAILGAIELTRRTTGWIIPTLIILALTYVTWWGNLIGGVFSFKGLTPETVMFRSIYGDDALFGQIATISSTYVFLFILFGAFLLRSGAGDFVVDVARAAAGRLIGGPGLVAVIASGLTGTISGSAVANTASTGVITIPLMKRAGFSPKFAAAVEATASTGGQLMPPIMGAGAFVMASYTQIAYETIVAVAAIPALLYFLSVAMFVRIEARRTGIQPMEEGGPSVAEAVRRGGASFIIPIGLLIGLLASGFTPTYAAVIGIGAVVVSSWLTQSPMGPMAVIEALSMGARNMVNTAVLLCAVGLVVNVIATAGVGNTFSLMIADWAGGNVLFAIVLIGLASLVLGMGLPVTAAYIVLATLSAPALAGMISDASLAGALAAGTVPPEASAILMLAGPDAAAALAGPLSASDAATLVGGLPLELRGALRDMALSPEVMTTALLSAHMIIFWLSQDSNVTPPVCLAAFTAAAIAKSPPMGTGFAAWKIAKGLYIVPILFAYTPILSGDWGAALMIGFFALFGLYALAAGLQGWMEGPLNPVFRLAALAAGAACLWPGSVWINLLGAAATVGLFILTRDRARPSPTPAAP